MEELKAPCLLPIWIHWLHKTAFSMLRYMKVEWCFVEFCFWCSEGCFKYFLIFRSRHFWTEMSSEWREGILWVWKGMDGRSICWNQAMSWTHSFLESKEILTCSADFSTWLRPSSACRIFRVSILLVIWARDWVILCVGSCAGFLST